LTSLEFTLQRVFCGGHGPPRTLKPTRNDARYQGKVSVWYPFHPFFNKHDFSVMRRFGCRNTEYLDLQAPGIRQAVPSWMVDADLCGQMTCGLQPAVDLSTLLELVRWLETHSAADL
jgi:hypothetical protein